MPSERATASLESPENSAGAMSVVDGYCSR